MGRLFLIRKVLKVRYCYRSGLPLAFFIRWKGFGARHDSWVTPECLDCGLRDFCSDWGLDYYRPAQQPWPGVFESVDEEGWEADV